MYNFIDVTEVSEESILPSEALKINGEYIENLISGYRTVSVQGREALSPDVISYTTGVRDGSKLKNKRYPERIIIVTYQITAATNEEFREAYNKLGKILDVEDAELIFNDEQDKFFVGTPCIIDAVTPGRNNVVGSFEILCTDPFKYSVQEYEAEVAAGESSVVFDYNGTYKAYPKLEASFYPEEEVGSDGETAGTLTGNGDCGFVAFFNEEEKIIQVGDPDEVDSVKETEKSQTLMNQTFLSETAWGTTAKALWSVNNGHIMANNVHQMGSVGMGKAATSTTYHSGLTSGHLLTDDYYNLELGRVRPIFTVRYSTKNRTANKVTVVITITCEVDADFPSGEVNAHVTVGGTKKLFELKDTRTTWKGGCSYTQSRSFEVSGLSASQANIKGTKIKVEYRRGSDTLTLVQETTCNNLSISPYSTTTASYYLTPSSYGTFSGGWHGPTITRTLGEGGATNFTLTYKQKMCISKSGSSQVGSFRMNIVDASGANIAGIWIYKNKDGKTGSLVFFVKGVKVNTTALDLHYENAFTGLSEAAVATTTVTKSGSTIAFAVGSYKRTFINSALATVKAAKVTFSFEQYSALEAMSYNGLYWAKFVRNNYETYKDIPNKFSANDVVVADCKEAEIYLNGIAQPILGALGNNWEAFYLTPGLNQIGVAYSSWVSSEYAPTFKVRYREVFL